MSQLRIYGVTFAALFAACVTYIAMIMLTPVIWWRLLLPLLEMIPESIQVPLIYGASFLLGSPRIFDLSWMPVFINSLSWGAWAALAYAFILRKGLGGRIHWSRLVILHLWTATMAYILVNFALSNITSEDTAFLSMTAIWFFTGLFIVRDWVVRP